mmetsp:Transcript_8397/g.21612  ORF Transcript_8397/g.21612 Transcript_8397/m.21612 type:complete len:89 (-) Transcript_8397:3-269(-)
MNDNIGGPDLWTTQRRWAKGKHSYIMGIAAANFIAVAKLCKAAKQANKIDVTAPGSPGVQALGASATGLDEHVGARAGLGQRTALLSP